MDLSRIELIQKASLEDLTSSEFLESLIPKLGFNTEILNEQPSIVKNNGGGLLIWQYPNQFSKYLQLIRTLNPSSYIEIGCRWGGTFVLTCEYLTRFNKLSNAVAVDIIDSPVAKYSEINKNASFNKLNSMSKEFRDYVADKHFDITFIDGDHSYEGVKNDFIIMEKKSSHFVFHDIDNAVCPGVVHFWNELKNSHADKFIFFEFIEQYPEVVAATGNHYLGIGVAVKR